MEVAEAAERDGDMELAYESYMGAAQQYSLAVKASTDDSAREQYNRRLSSAVQRAQQVRTGGAPMRGDRDEEAVLDDSRCVSGAVVLVGMFRRPSQQSRWLGQRRSRCARSQANVHDI